MFLDYCRHINLTLRNDIFEEKCFNYINFMYFTLHKSKSYFIFFAYFLVKIAIKRIQNCYVYQSF